jgi:glucose/arabinose dehydrogenase
MKNGKPTVKEPKGYEKFADGFAGQKIVESPGDADYRPMGLAQGPNGALYISDSQQGRVWKVIYTGE